MNQARIPRRVDEFRLEQMDEDLLLYHPGMTKAVRLNESASLVWQLVDGQRSVGEIVALLGGAYPEQASTVATDVVETLARLAEEGAIELK